MTNAERRAFRAGFRAGVQRCAIADEPLARFAIRLVVFVESFGEAEIDAEQVRELLQETGQAVHDMHLGGGDEVALTLHELERSL